MQSFPFLHPTSDPNHWHAFLGGWALAAFPLPFEASAPCKPFKEVEVPEAWVVLEAGVVVVEEAEGGATGGFLTKEPSCSSSASRCCIYLRTLPWLGLVSIWSSVLAKASLNLKSLFCSAVFLTMVFSDFTCRLSSGSVTPRSEALCSKRRARCRFPNI